VNIKSNMDNYSTYPIILIIIILIINFHLPTIAYSYPDYNDTNKTKEFTFLVDKIIDENTIEADNKIIKITPPNTNNHNDIKKQKDVLHFISVICPINSPITIVPDIQKNQGIDKENIIYGTIFCGKTNLIREIMKANLTY